MTLIVNHTAVLMRVEGPVIICPAWQIRHIDTADGLIRLELVEGDAGILITAPAVHSFEIIGPQHQSRMVIIQVQNEAPSVHLMALAK